MCSPEPGTGVQWDAGHVETTASFPNPARGWFRGTASLDRNLIANPPATFIPRVSGTGMMSSGLFDGDEIVVDRSLDISPGLVAVITVDGVHRIGRFRLDQEGRSWLVTDHDTIPLFDRQVDPFGVALYGIRHLNRQE